LRADPRQLHGRVDVPVPVEIAPTIAEGTAIAQPLRLKEVIAAIRRSASSTVAVSEDEIAEGFCRLAKVGLYVEPTSASTIPALRRMRETGAIKPEDTTVLVLTGSGLKATQRTAAPMGMSMG
jgi:threonine synthase